MIKRWTGILLASLLLFSGFSFAQDIQQTPDGDVETTVAMVVQNGETVSLFPYQAIGDEQQQFLSSMVFDTLIERNRDGVPENCMAEKYEIDDQYLNYTITLKEGLFWHDGQPVTVEDVIFSFLYAKNSDVPYYSYAANQPSAITKVDDRTFVITFAKAHPNYVHEGLCTIPILPKHVYENGDTSKIIGSSGYKLQSQDEKSVSLVTSGFAYYKRRLASSLTVRFVPGIETATNGLREGEFDGIMDSLYGNTKDVVKGKAELISVNTDGLLTQVFVMNNRVEPFTDVHYRKAISKAIDYKKIIDEVYGGHGKEGQPGFFNKSMQYANKDLSYGANVADAKKMLDDNGYILDGDVRKDKNGKELIHQVIVTNSQDEQVALKLAEQLKEIGIVLQVKTGTQEQLNNDTFETAIMSFDVNYQWDEESLLILLGSKDFTKWNVAGYESDAFTQLENDYSGTVDPSARLNALYAMQQQITDDMPIITLCYPSKVQLYNYARFDGYVEQFGTGIFFKGSFYENIKTLAKASNDAMFAEKPAYLNPFLVGGITLTLVGITILIWYLVRKRKKKQ